MFLVPVRGPDFLKQGSVIPPHPKKTGGLKKTGKNPARKYQVKVLPKVLQEFHDIVIKTHGYLTGFRKIFKKKKKKKTVGGGF
jgi:hypothetical protein